MSRANVKHPAIQFVNYNLAVSSCSDYYTKLTMAIAKGEINSVIFSVPNNGFVPQCILESIMANLEFANRGRNSPVNAYASSQQLSYDHLNSCKYVITSMVTDRGDGRYLEEVHQQANIDGNVIICGPLPDDFDTTMSSATAVLVFEGLSPKYDGSTTVVGFKAVIRCAVSLGELSLTPAYADVGLSIVETDTDEGIEALYNYLGTFFPSALRRFCDDVLSIELLRMSRNSTFNDQGQNMLLAPSRTFGDFSYKLSLINDTLLINVVSHISMVRNALVRGINVTMPIDNAVRYVTSRHLAPIPYLYRLRTIREKVNKLSQLPANSDVEKAKMINNILRFDVVTHVVNETGNGGNNISEDVLRRALGISPNILNGGHGVVVTDTVPPVEDERLLFASQYNYLGVYGDIAVAELVFWYKGENYTLYVPTVLEPLPPTTRARIVSEDVLDSIIGIHLDYKATVFWKDELVVHSAVRHSLAMVVKSDYELMCYDDAAGVVEKYILNSKDAGVTVSTVLNTAIIKKQVSQLNSAT